MSKYKVPYMDLRDAALAAKAYSIRPVPAEMDNCVAELKFWLMQYEIGQPLPEGYKLTECPYDEEEE